MDEELNINNVPVSTIYKACYESLKKKRLELGEGFSPNIAVRAIARTHTRKVKDIIDEDMNDYDEKQLLTLVERCVLKYVDVENDIDKQENV